MLRAGSKTPMMNIIVIPLMALYLNGISVLNMRLPAEQIITSEVVLHLSSMMTFTRPNLQT